MKHTDPIDEGTETARLFTEGAIKAHSAKVAPEQQQVLVRGADGVERLEWEHTDCIDCGEPIEKERLDWGRIRCCSCQNIKETRRAQYR